MKEYTKPVVEITALNNEDVVTVSGGIATSKTFTVNGDSKYTAVNF
jgi:hypothetical protein